MRELMPRKQYVGEIRKWSADRRKLTVQTSWGLEVQISKDEVVLALDRDYVIFRKRPSPILIQGGAS